MYFKLMSIVQEKSCCRCGSGTQRKIEEKVDEEKAAKGKTDQPPLLKPDMDDEEMRMIDQIESATI